MIIAIYSIFFLSEIVDINNLLFNLSLHQNFSLNSMIINKNIVFVICIILMIFGVAFVKLVDSEM